MADPNLVALSLSAFLAVAVVLSVLALVIRVLAFAFRESVARPAPTSGDAHADAALVAALHAAMQVNRPGYRITRIDDDSSTEAS